MKKILILVALLITLGLGWYFLSPLFLDQTVDEAFPISSGKETVNSTDSREENNLEPTLETEQNEDDSNGEASDEESKSLEDENAALNPHNLTQEEIDSMSEEEKMEMEKKIVEEMADEPVEVMEEMMPEISNENTEPTLLSEGQFEDADNFHQGEGNAKIYQLPNGDHLLRFEDFEVTNGPDLRVYLVKEENPTKDQVKNGLEIAKLKGNKGNQNYNITMDGLVNFKDYKSVVIYCKPFSVIFSVANLR